MAKPGKSRPLTPLKPRKQKKTSPSNKDISEIEKSIDLKKIHNSVDFYNADFQNTLFPLETNHFIVNFGKEKLDNYISKCLDENERSYSFLPQTRVYSSKPGGYLRRTVKLDPVSEYYIYDVIYRNKARFRKPHNALKSHYGYRFENGSMIPATQSYKGFKGAISDYRSKFKFSYGADVATYFNSIYHHDIVSWLYTIRIEERDAEGLGQMLREIASGRSIDCLPQGLYPTKMIGNDFLRYIDEFHDIKSDAYVRFIDDIYWFSNNEQTIKNDFQMIQRLLGDKGLSLNPRKTIINESSHINIDKNIDEIKYKLLKRRRIEVLAGYDDSGDEVIREDVLKFPLSDKEMDYLDKILSQNSIEEDDAELILTIMRGNTSRAEKKIPYIINKYPHLTKNVHSFFAHVSDKDFIANTIINELDSNSHINEYQLFWMCCSFQSYLIDTTYAPSLISLLFNHRSATQITKAKILEINDVRYGLQDLRNQYLHQSDWLGWASAVGSRGLNSANRNHKLKYFAKCSNMNHLIAEILQDLP